MTVREQLEDAVERAIDALNAFDGDAEAEDSGDAEPSADREHWTQPANLSKIASP